MTKEPLILENLAPVVHDSALAAINAAIRANLESSGAAQPIEGHRLSSFRFTLTAVTMSFEGEPFSIFVGPSPSGQPHNWSSEEVTNAGSHQCRDKVPVVWGTAEETWEPYRLLESRLGKRFKKFFRSDSGIYLYWHDDPLCLAFTAVRNISNGETQLYWFEST